MKPSNCKGVLGVFLAAGLMAATPARESVACGYHDPQQVSRGFLNWTYPDSLHVLGAISMEIAARRLPPPDIEDSGPDLFGKKYRAAAAMLEQLGTILGESGASLPPVSLVLVEPMLWARFESAPQRINTRVHVSGPQPGDLILVSGEVVVREIVARRLTLDEAHARGLLRLYGSDGQLARFRAVHRHAGIGTVRQTNVRANPADVAGLASAAVDAQASCAPGHALYSSDLNGGGKP